MSVFSSSFRVVGFLWLAGACGTCEQVSSAADPGEERAAPPPVASLSDAEIFVLAEKFRVSRPAFEQGVGALEIPEGLADLSAATCGACHQEIYAEWQLSTHRRAWLDDAQYQAELEKNRHGVPLPLGDGTRAADMSWNCIQCHTPIVAQQPHLVIGLEDGQPWFPRYVDNPAFDPELQLEAVTCAVCHVRDGVVLGPYGDTNAPHATRRDELLLSESLCTSCHQARAEYEEINLACMFDTGTEWAEHSSDQTCQSCHMPEIERPLMAGFPVRRTRYHYFGGSLIPKRPEFEAELAPLRLLFGSGAELYVESSPEGPVVRVENTSAGHLLPTGDPERHIEVTVSVVDALGVELSHHELLIGAIYEWDPMARLISDNRIAPGESERVPLGVLPEDAAEIHVEAHKYRMHQDAFDYHELEGEYVRGRRFHRSVWSVSQSGITRTSLVDDRHPASPRPTD